MFKSFILFLSLISTVCVGQQKLYLKLLDKVSLDSLKKYEYRLASEEFCGREVNTKTGLLSSNYISDCFRSNGLKPILEKGTSFSQQFYFDIRYDRMNTTVTSTAKRTQFEPYGNDDYWAQNIIGILSGRNPKSGHIVITAHHDHVGIVDNEIHYGADDNGSGVSALLEVSRILGEASRKGIRAKRTIVFVSTDAEEKTLIGSDFYVKHPVLPLKETYCAVNLDMIGRIDSAHSFAKNTNKYIYTLYRDTTNRLLNEKYLFRLNKTYTQLLLDDRYEKEVENIKQYSLFTRSDQYPFMQCGIPVIWFFSGFHDDYHQTTDTPDKINYPELKERVRYILALIWDLANK
jgi:Zn-dependent M28 family amino/carboxypeptidase